MMKKKATEAMVQAANDDAERSSAGALEALFDVAQEPGIVSEYRTVNAVFGPDDYEQIIALAWRYQFSEDRSKFKREIRELQEQVSQRIIANLEQSE
jgi:hypothetical protein